MKIKGKFEGTIDVKRFYLEGIELKYTCPNCGEEKVFTDYLSYPKVNEVESVDFWCCECDHEWTETVILTLTVKCN